MDWSIVSKIGELHMNKFFEYLTIIMAVIGTIAMYGAVGAIETDQWLLAGSMTLLGLASYLLALYSQELFKENTD